MRADTLLITSLIYTLLEEELTVYTVHYILCMSQTDAQCCTFMMRALSNKVANYLQNGKKATIDKIHLCKKTKRIFAHCPGWVDVCLSD